MATAPNASQTSSDTRAPGLLDEQYKRLELPPRHGAECQAADEGGDEAVAVQRHRRGIRAHRQAQPSGAGEPLSGPSRGARQPDPPAARAARRDTDDEAE